MKRFSVIQVIAYIFILLQILAIAFRFEFFFFSQMEMYSELYYNPSILSCKIIINDKTFKFENIQKNINFCSRLLKLSKDQAILELQYFFKHKQGTNIQKFTVYRTSIKKNNTVTVLPYREEIENVFIKKSK